MTEPTIIAAPYKSHWETSGDVLAMYAEIEAAGLRVIAFGHKPRNPKTGKPAHRWAQCVPDRNQVTKDRAR